jgi:hypothetical protein
MNGCDWKNSRRFFLTYKLAVAVQSSSYLFDGFRLAKLTTSLFVKVTIPPPEKNNKCAITKNMGQDVTVAHHLVQQWERSRIGRGDMDTSNGNSDHPCTAEMAPDLALFNTQLAWLSKQSSDFYALHFHPTISN